MNPQASPMGGFAPVNQGFNLNFQSQMMTQMMAMMTMLMQQLMSTMGGAMSPASANFGGSEASAGLGNFLGGSTGGSASAPAASSGTSAAPSTGATTNASDIKGTEFGKKFAAQAEKTARRINTPGLCLKGVNDTMEAMGMPVQREASAYMALDNFQNNKRFQEIKVSKDQLKSLPAGAVVIWDKGPGLPHGHISVSLGDGREASSTVRNQLNLKTNFHVFVPKE